MELVPRCQNRSCAISADKEGESVLIWARVQSNLDWDGGGGGRGNVGTRLTEAFMLEGASTDKKTQGPAVSPCKDRGELRHLGFYSRLKCLKLAFWGITAACGKSCLLTYSTSRAELACALQISTCVCSLISPLPFLIGSFFSVVRNLFTFCLFGSFSWELSPATNKCSAR